MAAAYRVASNPTVYFDVMQLRCNIRRCQRAPRATTAVDDAVRRRRCRPSSTTTTQLFFQLWAHVATARVCERTYICTYSCMCLILRCIKHTHNAHNFLSYIRKPITLWIIQSLIIWTRHNVHVVSEENFPNISWPKWWKWSTTGCVHIMLDSQTIKYTLVLIWNFQPTIQNAVHSIRIHQPRIYHFCSMVPWAKACNEFIGYPSENCWFSPYSQQKRLTV